MCPAMCARRGLLLLCCALLAADGDARVLLRCTELVDGAVGGEPLALEPVQVPAATRRYNLTIPDGETCGTGAAGLAGVIVTACDVLPPQVQLVYSAAGQWLEARVLRLGPTWLPLLLELTLFCDTHPPTSTSTVAPTSPTTVIPTTSSVHGPIVVPKMQL